MRRYHYKPSAFALIAAFWYWLRSPRLSPITAPTSRVIVIDGDTIRVDTNTYRLSTLDAPELFAPRCAHELALAVEAKQALVALIQASRTITLNPTGRDRYGRTLTRLLIDDRDIRDLLETSRVLRPIGNTRPTWCSCSTYRQNSNN